MNNSPLLMIPGPTEFHPDVLRTMSTKGTSHVDPSFISCFSNVIKQTRNVFLADDGQPFILAGSGTLGWDLTAANFVIPGDNVLVINTGYFGDTFGECLETYGLTVQHVRANSPGDIPCINNVISALENNKNIKLVTITHVDTSTGVRVDLNKYVSAIRRVSPNVLVAIDGVCALGGEEMRMKDWDIDIYITGSQKAIGVPPGLSISVIRPRALHKFENLLKENHKPRSHYANVKRWLPIMKAYEDNKPSYYATPAVNLIMALEVAYNLLLQNGGMEKRFEEHKRIANKFRNELRKQGFSFVPIKEEYAANTMSAVRYPQLNNGYSINDFRFNCKKLGIICAGGLYPSIKNEYFRVGHMGFSTRIHDDSHINQAISAITNANKLSSKL